MYDIDAAYCLTAFRLCKFMFSILEENTSSHEEMCNNATISSLEVCVKIKHLCGLVNAHTAL